MSLILWGQIRRGSGLAAILNASSPLFTVLLAHVFPRDERMTPNRVGGVLFGLAGGAVMIGPDALGGLSGDLAGQSWPCWATRCHTPAPAYSAGASAAASRHGADRRRLGRGSRTGRRPVAPPDGPARSDSFARRRQDREMTGAAVFQ
jgi:MFS family permease